MLIFIDESGDAGFKIEKGSSNSFTIAMVIFDDNLVAEETALALKKLKRTLRKPDTYEFKFNKCSKEYRLMFLKEVKGFKYRIRAIVFNKSNIFSPTLRSSKDKFYSYALKELFKHSGGTIKDAKVRLDGFGERAFKNSLTVYLRKNLNSEDNNILDNLRFKDSKSDMLIQLADMVAGAINRSYTNKEDAKSYVKVIKSRIEDIWEFE